MKLPLSIVARQKQDRACDIFRLFHPLDGLLFPGGAFLLFRLGARSPGYIARRDDDAFIDELGRQGVAYVPFFPLGGFTPLQSSELNAVAASVSATPMRIALAWLLHRAPNILLIPGTSSVKHLRENLKAAALELSQETIAKLNSIGVGA